MKIYSEPTCFSGRCGLWLSRECLLYLEAGIKQQMEGSGFRGADLCDPLEME